MDNTGTLEIISIEKLWCHNRRRQVYNEIEELSNTIKTFGLIEPLIVRPIPLYAPPGFTHQVVAGGRRYMACMAAPLLDIPCLVRTDLDDEDDFLEVELIENTNREDMTWQEEMLARADIHNAKLKKNPEQSLSETGRRLGVSPATMSLDYELASASTLRPELLQCSSKSEAFFKLKQLKKAAVTKAIVEKIDKEQAQEPTDLRRIKMVRRYKVGDFFTWAEHETAQHTTYDLVEVDPPYGIDLKERKTTTAVHYNEVDSLDYERFILQAADACYKYLKPGGWLIWWFAIDPWFQPTYDALTRVGFRCCALPAIWCKNTDETDFWGGNSNPRMRLSSCYESFFYAYKPFNIVGMDSTVSLNSPGQRNTLLYPPVDTNKKRHPTQRPIEMMRFLIRTFVDQGSKILVPFAGSGVTLLAADMERCDAIGFDLSTEYHQAYYRHIYGCEPGRWID